MMLVVVALFVWFALSVPATFLLGRLITTHIRDRDVPFGAVPASGHRLIGR